MIRIFFPDLAENAHRKVFLSIITGGTDEIAIHVITDSGTNTGHNKIYNIVVGKLLPFHLFGLGKSFVEDLQYFFTYGDTCRSAGIKNQEANKSD
jgi:hypothetical protein